jgi:ATP-dependent DNA helicase RecQ
LRVCRPANALVYAAPERLRQARFVELLARVGIGLVVVDEVHCVSMWGHDFRPDYLFIRRALEAFGRPTVLGMTATATPAMAREIGDALGRSLDVCTRA